MRRTALFAALLVATLGFAQNPNATMPPGPGAGRITAASVWQISLDIPCRRPQGVR